MLPAELKNLAYGVEQATGCSVGFFAGSLEVVGADGNIHRANGYFDGDNSLLMVRVDSGIYEPWQLLAHEEFHALAERYPELVERIRNRILERYGQRELSNIVLITSSGPVSQLFRPFLARM